VRGKKRPDFIEVGFNILSTYRMICMKVFELLLHLVFKTQWSIYIPLSLKVSNVAFRVMFCMILSANVVYFLKQR
jgi:hypothetical protein